MLSNSSRYGIRAVIYLASQSLSNEKTGIKKISRDLDLPTPYLAKILQVLVRHKILISLKGPHGGFSLMKEPREISLLDIVNAIEGTDIFTNCIMHNGSCSSTIEDRNKCPLHDDYEKIRSNLIKLFRNKTIYDLVRKTNKGEVITI